MRSNRIYLLFTLIIILVNACKPDDDTDLPYILLDGDNPYFIDSIGGSFTEPGYKGVDDIDGDLTSRIQVNYPSIQGDSAKSYDVVYSLTDNSGNTFSTTRKVIVRNTAAFLEGYYLHCSQLCDNTTDTAFAANIVASQTINNQFSLFNFGNHGASVPVQCTLDRATGKINFQTPQLLADSATLLTFIPDSSYFIDLSDSASFQIHFTYSNDTLTESCRTLYRK